MTGDPRKKYCPCKPETCGRGVDLNTCAGEGVAAGERKGVQAREAVGVAVGVVAAVVEGVNCGVAGVDSVKAAGEATEKAGEIGDD
jgi:hypothetical protein